MNIHVKRFAGGFLALLFGAAVVAVVLGVVFGLATGHWVAPAIALVLAISYGIGCEQYP